MNVCESKTSQKKKLANNTVTFASELAFIIRYEVCLATAEILLDNILLTFIIFLTLTHQLLVQKLRK